jgi:hybrid cluster-associated redox disulfide protein
MSSGFCVTKSTKIEEVVRRSPAARDVFARHGMECYACFASSAETVEEGALMHDIDVDLLVEELNAACRSEE